MICCWKFPGNLLPGMAIEIQQIEWFFCVELLPVKSCHIIRSLCVNSLMAGDEYKRHWIGSSLVLVMTCRLFGDKLLPEPIMHDLLLLRNNIQWNWNQNTTIFFQENVIEAVVCNMSAILFVPLCAKRPRWGPFICLPEEPAAPQFNYESQILSDIQTHISGRWRWFTAIYLRVAIISEKSNRGNYFHVMELSMFFFWSCASLPVCNKHLIF